MRYFINDTVDDIGKSRKIKNYLLTQITSKIIKKFINFTFLAITLITPITLKVKSNEKIE